MSEEQDQHPGVTLLSTLLEGFYPVGEPLTAKYKLGFGFKTIGHRLPVIVTKVIDQLSRDKNEIGDKLGMEAREEVKVVVGALAKLKNEMQTNKTVVRINSDVWDSYLDHMAKLYFRGNTADVKWYFAPWLYVECYFYQRIHGAFQLTKHLKTFDPFKKQKEQAWLESADAAAILGEFLDSSEFTDETLQKFLEISLWGNRCDLSISSGDGNSQLTNLVDQLIELKKFILCDESTKLWETLRACGKENGNTNNHKSSSSIGYVLDNAGFELFTDLCFADALMNVVDRVDFHVKVIPWFISDAMSTDFCWLLDAMSNAHDHPVLVKLAQKWKQYLSSGKWTVIENPFWTYPHAFHEMSTADPKLYSTLSQNTHLIFKGDLNYRKLIGDVNWPTDTLFQTSLQGFNPAPLIALRTVKADCISGLPSGLGEKMSAENSEWMINGQYGVIQHGH